MKRVLLGTYVRKALKISMYGLGIALVLLTALLLVLPSLVSTGAVQTKLKSVLSTSMKREVGWTSFRCAWSGGVSLDGLKLGDGPAPLLKCTIEQLRITPSLGRGKDGHFGVDLAVLVRSVNAELAPGPAKPPPPKSTKDPLTQLAEAIQNVQRLDIPLPVDVRVHVDVEPLQLVYHAPAPALPVTLKDVSFRFAMPSLAAQPITAQVKGGISHGRRSVGFVSLSAAVSSLVTGERRIRLTPALFDVNATFPGTAVTFSGGLSHRDGFAGRVTLKLPELLSAVRPLLSPATPAIAGEVDLQLKAHSDRASDLRAEVALDATGVSARGGKLGARRAGPFDLHLQQKIVTDHIRQRVEFPGGHFSMPDLLSASWSAMVSEPTRKERAVQLSVGPVTLDLAHARSLASPFIPAHTPLRDLTGELTLGSLALNVKGPENRGELAVKECAVTLPKLKAALKGGDLATEEMTIRLARAACPLDGMRPSAVTAELLWNIGKLVRNGTEPLTVRKARGTVGVTVRDLVLKSPSPRKITAALSMRQTFDCDRVALGSRLSVDGISEKLAVTARAAENGDLHADLPEFSVSAAAIKGMQGTRQFGPLPCVATLTADGLRLPFGPGVQPVMNRAAASFSGGDFLLCSVNAALTGAAHRSAAVDGSMRLDMHRAMQIAAPFVPAGVKADGVVSAIWRLSAPIPEKSPAPDANQLRAARSWLALIDTFDLGVKLDARGVSLPSARGTVTATGIQSGPDLRITVADHGRSTRCEGGIRFAGVSGLATSTGPLAAQHATLRFNGELTDWKLLHLFNEFHVEPLGIAQELDLNVSRLDTLMDEKQPFTTATLIRRLDATLFASLDGAFPRTMKPLLPGIDMSGAIGSTLRLDLTAGRELALRGALKTRDFGVQLANGTRVEGMRSDISFDRIYTLAAARADGWTPLSASLVRPVTGAATNPGAADIAGRISEDLRGNMGGARSFTISKVTTKASGIPLVLTAIEGDLLLSTEKLGLSYLQADLLGGTLLARSVFDLRPELPVIALGSSFSNLDVSLLLPQRNGTRQGDQDAEITGDMTLSAPVTAEQRELLEQLRLAANVRKIGTRTLERALFSLDPYERNEQVVSQRKMLRMGGLKGLRAAAVDGAFSMEGEAQIKGVAVDLPKVERIRISELPLRQEIVRNRAAITALRGALDLVRADTLVIGPKGQVSLKRRSYAQ